MKKLFVFVLFIFSVKANAQVNYIGYLPEQNGITADDVYCLSLDTSGLPTIQTGCNSCIDPPYINLFHFDGSQWVLLDTINSFDGLMAYDHLNNLWINSNDSLVKWNNGIINTFTLPMLPTGAGMGYIKFDSNNNLWSIVSFYNGGGSGNLIVKFDGANWTVFDSIQIGLLPGDYPNDITIDQNNNIFLTTNNSGLLKYNGTAWSSINSGNSNLPSGTSLMNLAVDSTGNVWITGVDSNSMDLYKYSGGSFTSINIWPTIMQQPSFGAMDIDGQGNIWLFADGNLVKYNGNFLSVLPNDEYYFSNTWFEINKKTNNIWFSGGGFAPSSIVAFNENGFQTIQGNVFNDANQNGLLDVGESGLVNEMITGSSGTYNLSDSTGHYALGYIDSTVTVNVSHVLKPYRIQTSVPATYSVIPSVNPTSNYNFGIYAYPNVNDLILDGFIYRARPGFTGSAYLYYENIGTTTLSDTITIVMDSLLQFNYATVAPVYQAGNTLKFAFQNFVPFDHHFIELYFTVSASANLGDTIHISGIINPVSTDTVPQNNIVDLKRVVNGSYDPNEKTVSPEGIGANGEISPTQELTYTIHFQNTGTDTAFTVVITDTLSTNLDISTFELVAYSHPVIAQITGNGLLRLTFPNILLPDSNVNEPGSNGFVKYRIKPKNNIPLNSQILNIAYIVFDYNSSIITNTTINTIALPSSIEETNGGNGITIFPNPSAGQFTLICPSLTDDKSDLQILDITGRTVFEKNSINKIETINYKLTQGLYFIKIKNESGLSLTRSLVISN